MGEKKENLDQTKRFTERITVYTSPKLKEEMETFSQTQGYGSCSAMLRRGYYLLKQLMGSSLDLTDQDIESKLLRIEKKLEEIELEQKSIESQENIIDTEFEQISLETIANYDQIESDILHFIKDFGEIKDFVIMEHFRRKYSEGIIWATLIKLKEQKKISMKEGVCKLK